MFVFTKIPQRKSFAMKRCVWPHCKCICSDTNEHGWRVFKWIMQYDFIFKNLWLNVLVFAPLFNTQKGLNLLCAWHFAASKRKTEQKVCGRRKIIFYISYLENHKKTPPKHLLFLWPYTNSCCVKTVVIIEISCLFIILSVFSDWHCQPVNLNQKVQNQNCNLKRCD